MYQSLYRKYRPSNFDEVVGQEVVVQTLKNAITKDCINHAYLFTGPRGTGKTSIAKIFAKTINCENVEKTNPCNKCVSCTQINNKQSVDIIEIDAASNNGVDEIRELRNKASLVPAVAKYKVYIIDEVHMLTTGAFNALLKTLEEPPKHIVFILATTEPHKIPATILSRCQRFDFKKISKQKMIDKLKEIVLKENVKVEDLVYQEIAELSDGCMRDALSILDQVIAYSGDEVTLEDVHEVNGSVPHSVLITFLQSIVNKNYKDTFSIIDEYDNQGKNFVKLTEELLGLLRNLMLLQTIPEYDFDISIKNEYQKIVNQFTDGMILRYIKVVNETIVDMKKSNNVKILFEMMVVKLLNDHSLNNVVETVTLQQKEIETTQSIEKAASKETVNQEKKEEVPFVDNIPLEDVVLKTDKVIDEKALEKLQNIQKIRINNTLCNFNKKQLLEIKNHIDQIRNLLINSDYSEVASIVLDGELKAASNDSLIFVYKIKRMELEFNKNILKIDAMLLEAFHKPFKAIATDADTWEHIKAEFNGKKKTYTLMQEPDNLEEYLGTEETEETYIDNMFGDIVEYS